MPFDSPGMLASPTGATLALRHQPADGPPRAVLLIQHGLAEHSGRYARFARLMAGRGFAVYAHDHRGHGRTRAADAPAGRFAARDGAARVLADCRAVADHAAAAHSGLPLVLLGHSMGGLIALNLAQSRPAQFAALAVWNANFERPSLARAACALLAFERMRLGSDVPSRLLPRLTFEAWGRSVSDARSPLDWLSRDRTAVTAYGADPLCGFAPSVAMWRDVFALILAGQKSAALAALPAGLPINLVGGSDDPATAGGSAVRRLARMMHRSGLSDVTVSIDAGARHETLNDTHAEAAMARFAAWAEGALERERAKTSQD